MLTIGLEETTMGRQTDLSGSMISFCTSASLKRFSIIPKDITQLHPQQGRNTL